MIVSMRRITELLSTGAERSRVDADTVAVGKELSGAGERLSASLNALEVLWTVDEIQSQRHALLE